MADQVELEDGVQPDTTAVCSHGTPAGDCKKCADAARKRKQREKEKQEKKKEKESQLPLAEWQEANRKELSKDQNAELAQRHEEVLDQIHWLKAWINDTYNVDPSETDFYVGLEEGIEDMERDVKQYGVLLGYDVLSNLVRAYRKDSEYRANLKNTKMWGELIFNEENADEIWIKYGYLAAIPSQMTCDIRMKSRGFPNSATSGAEPDGSRRPGHRELVRSLEGLRNQDVRSPVTR
jgi:hypothetical protein